MALSKQTPDNDFRPMPELEGAEITFYLANGSVRGPFILRTEPFVAGAKALDGRILVFKERIYVCEADRQAYLEAKAAYDCGFTDTKPNEADYQVTTGQFTVLVNGKRTEKYSIRFPRKRVKKKRFAYI